MAVNKAKIKEQTPTVQGSTGIFNIFVADTLRKGEYSFALGGRFHRGPGGITVFPVSFTAGLHQQIELFVSYELYKWLDSGGIVGDTNTVGSRIAVLSNDTPFGNLGSGGGAGDLRTGFKFNLASERRGQALGLALQNIFRLSVDHAGRNLEPGLTAGQKGLGFDLILSKDAGRATFSANAGLMWVSRTSAGEWPVERRNRFNWGLGVDIPLGRSKARLMGELVGSALEGDRTTAFVDTRSLLDLYGGLRVFAGQQVALSAAYNLNLANAGTPTEATGRHGWFFQLALQRKLNRPPTILCSSSAISLIEGDSVAVTPKFDDPDDDELTVTWTASRGRLYEPGATVVFDSTGLGEGSYALKVEATDGQNVASCSSDIRVEKRKMPPTIACEPSVTNVTEGGSVTLRPAAFDPNGDGLTYSWTVDGEAVPNDRAEFEFGTVGRAVGPHQVKVTVTDTDGLSTSCEMKVIVDC